MKIHLECKIYQNCAPGRHTGRPLLPAAAPASSRSCQISTSHPKAAAAPPLLLLLLLLLPPPLLPAASNTRLKSRMG